MTDYYGCTLTFVIAKDEADKIVGIPRYFMNPHRIDVESDIDYYIKELMVPSEYTVSSVYDPSHHWVFQSGCEYHEVTINLTRSNEKL